MTNEFRPMSVTDPEMLEQRDLGTSGRIDRRSLFRGVAALAVGGLSAPGALAQAASEQSAPATADGTDSGKTLEVHTNRVLRWAGRNPATWVRARANVDHNVVIVGGGQNGIAIAYALLRKGVGGVEVIDQAEPGKAGIWRTIARMHQLRTPKTLMPGPEGGNVALSFRAWYETLTAPARTTHWIGFTKRALGPGAV